jgi:Cellulase (glycosyl hydrolase family 5)
MKVYIERNNGQRISISSLAKRYAGLAKHYAGLAKHYVSFSVSAVLICLVSLSAFTFSGDPSLAGSDPVKTLAFRHQEVPVGITLSGLENYTISPSLVNYMRHQIYAARYYWLSNTIRLQIVQGRMIGNGYSQDSRYMSVVRELTGYALSLGLKVVLNDQTENSIGYSSHAQLPDFATKMFWEYMAEFYANNSDVIFDIFNEPRRCNWSQWYNAFQWIVNALRRQGINNTFWIEGIDWGSTLAGIPLLTGKNLVYSFHHPGCSWQYNCQINEAEWYSSFGYLAEEGVPVVDGEITFYNGGFDFPTAKIHQFLSYLLNLHVGLMAWSELGGVLNGRTGLYSVSHEPDGAGSIFRKWFASHPHTVTERTGGFTKENQVPTHHFRIKRNRRMIRRYSRRHHRTVLPPRAPNNLAWLTIRTETGTLPASPG